MQIADIGDLLFDFSIDRGGTFTDIFCQVYCRKPRPNKPYYEGVEGLEDYFPEDQNEQPRFIENHIHKLLSEDSHYDDAPREGIRKILSTYLQREIPREKVPAAQIRSIRMGTTVATNALLEKKGARTGLVITKGNSKKEKQKELLSFYI